MTPRSLLVLFAGLGLTACGSGKGGVTIYNTPPNVTISTPPSGSSFDKYEVITFTAKVGDDQDAAPDLDVYWSSSIDGDLAGGTPPDGDGFVSYSTANLSAGNHVITLTAVDGDAESGGSTVQITINDVAEAPQINLVHPASGESGLEGEPFEFVIEVSDTKDAPEDLVLSFESDRDGVFCVPTADEVGVASCSQELSSTSAGEAHLLTFTATDSDGEVGTATAYFVVTERTAFDDDGDGWSELQGDCDDDDDDVHPGAEEQLNGEDDDCDGIIDNNTAGYDDDGDGYSESTGDCDDADATVYPGGTETYDGDDEDCDGLVDEGTTGYDDDGDGYTEIAGDCDDGYALSYPGATELPDGRDNDCDGIEDEGTTLYDDDGDGYSEAAGDCDDTDATISPSATETCGDGDDNDCNGEADEAGASGCVTYYRDYDGDAYGTSTYSECLCSAEEYYTSRYSNDCYDYNANANPSATSYFSSHRGDGSYDYNCDSTETKYYTATGDCDWSLWSCDTTTGWSGSVRSCGTAGAYVTGCSTCGALGTDCCESTTTYSQYCR